jgi:hypothetical protein
MAGASVKKSAPPSILSRQQRDIRISRNRFGWQGAERIIGPRFARTRWRLRHMLRLLPITANESHTVFGDAIGG